MYSSLLWILTAILVGFIVLVLIIRQIKLQKVNMKAGNLFMTTEDAISYISNKAELTADEEEKLEILLPLAGSNRLYSGFDDEEPARKWLTNTQRVLYHTDKFDPDTKEDLVYTCYEIYRKIQVARTLNNPTITSVKSISPGQTLTITDPEDGHSISGDLLTTDIRSIQMVFKTQYFSALKKIRDAGKKVRINFWKKLDAGYSFDAHVIDVATKNDICIVSLAHPTTIKRTNIRRNPRKDAMISCRFKVGSSHMSSGGGMEEEFGAMTLGLISNIGVKGCNIITPMAMPNDSLILTEFPLFDQTFHIKGMVRKIQAYNSTYILNIEFTEEISRKEIVYIYHFIFSDIDNIEF
ncbi:MAG: hypothetical protein ACRCS8_03325 [Brevinema sp.]